MIWNCCRLCLSETKLSVYLTATSADQNFKEPPNVVFRASGVKILPTDELPQEMCVECILFINNSTQFRMRCREAQKILIQRLKDEKKRLNTKKTSKKLKVAPRNEINTVFVKASSESDLKQDFNEDVKEFSKELSSKDFLKDTNPEQQDKDSTCSKIDDIKTEPLSGTTEDQKDSSSDDEACKMYDEIKIAKEPQKQYKRAKAQKDLRPNECARCRTVFLSEADLAEHKQFCKKPLNFLCKHCGKAFINSHRLLCHCKAKHGYEKTDKCKFCDYKGITPFEVKLHERTHTNDRPYVCSECQASFHRINCYRQHLARSHPKETDIKFQCEICSKTFSDRFRFATHRTKHKNREFRYQCPICSNVYSSPNFAYRHLKKIHSLSGREHKIVKVAKSHPLNHSQVSRYDV